MRKGKTHIKPCKSECVNPIWFGWLPRITWKMAMTDNQKILHQMKSGLSLRIQSKRVADGSAWDEKKKQIKSDKI